MQMEKGEGVRPGFLIRDARATDIDALTHLEMDRFAS